MKSIVKQITLIVFFFFLLISNKTIAQGELKLTITIGNTTASGPITISIYDETGTTLLFTYNNAANSQLINPADWGAPAATTYQAWYSNNITSFTANANNGFNPRIQSINQ